MTVAYILGRTRHFQVLARQYAFSLILLAIASTALLGVGGWLVIRGELTLGQLVAAELVVTAIVSAFAKIGKSLEVFYDLLAAFDKVGHLVDVPCDLPIVLGRAERNPAAIRFQGLPIAFQGMAAEHVETIAPGSRIALTGPSGSGKSRFLEILSGLHEPVEGFAEIAGVDAREAARAASGAIVALARQPEIFAGSLLENIRLGRHWLSSAEIRLTLESVGLWEDILRLPNGLNTQLQTGGYPLTYAQCVRAMLARSLAGAPKVLLIDGILDLMDPDERWILWKQLTSMQESRTILVATHDQRIAKDCHRLLQCGRRSPATRQPIGTSS